MSYHSLYKTDIENFLTENETLIKKATIHKIILLVIWTIITLLGITGFQVELLFGIFSTAIAFMVTGLIVQTISIREYNNIVKNSIKYFKEISEYNPDKKPEHYLTLDLFGYSNINQTELKYILKDNNYSYQVYDQFIININSQIIDYSTQEMRIYAKTRTSNERKDITLWNGQLFAKKHNMKHDYTMIISNTDDFKPRPIKVQDTNYAPFCQTYNVSVSDQGIFNDWNFPNLNDIIQQINSIIPSFSIIITNKTIILAIYFAGINYFDPVLWRANVKKNLERDFEYLSKIIEISKLITQIDIIEK
ncbi:MAG: hypothetical protein MJ211_09855 [Bacteroidales bacterium]|nr:hypothetical protein [Bacteroidales bacterium]